MGGVKGLRVEGLTLTLRVNPLRVEGLTLTLNPSRLPMHAQLSDRASGYPGWVKG